jgi:hypothetical protein
MKNSSKRVLCATLQVAVPLVGIGTYLLEWRFQSFLMYMLLQGTPFVAVVLGAIAFVRRKQNGFTLLQFALAAVVVWGKWMLFYLALILALGITADPPSLFMALVFLWSLEVASFATACQAYFGLGRFQTRISVVQHVRQLVRSKSDLSLGRAASPSQIVQAEHVLGVRLPKSYKEFLRTTGEIRSLSIRFLGLSPNVDLQHPTVDDLMGATLFARERFGLPGSYVLCGMDTDDQLICLDTSATVNDEAPVVRWNPEARSAAAWLAASFAEYLVVRLKTEA